ncbi:MAG: hypothetical protein RIQ89_1629 [Bacteroidota bacterium]|jgi:hypothetical protein
MAMNLDFEEVKQHFNKIATLYLKNNKRKVGWLFTEEEELQESKSVFFICVQKGKKLMTSSNPNLEQLRAHREKISLNDIQRIRSSR